MSILAVHVDHCSVPEQEDSSDRTNEAKYEILDLFDFKTLKWSKRESIISSTVVINSKPVFVDGILRVVEERFLSYSEDFSRKPRCGSLLAKVEPLLMVRGCGNKDTLPSMPCLRLHMLGLNNYNEPIRNRDKDWRIDSQRDILDESGSHNQMPLLELGKYGKIKITPAVQKLKFPMKQATKREKHLFQFSTIISETHCLVDVLGSGIDGRIFVEGRNTDRTILIGIYSFWNSEKYTLSITAVDLAQMLTKIEKRNLMKPGMKNELIRAIIERCFFTYIVTTPSASTHKTKVYELEHLSPLNISPEFPRSIREIMRETSLPEHLRAFHRMPTLTQELKVGPEKRENYRVVREREEPERLRKAAADDERAAFVWASTSKRKRGRVYSQVRRVAHRMLVFYAHRFPMKKPGVCALKGYSRDTGVALPLTVILSEMAVLFHLRGDTKNWSPSTIRLAVKCAVNDITVLTQRPIPGLGPNIPLEVKNKNNNISDQEHSAKYMGISSDNGNPPRECKTMIENYLKIKSSAGGRGAAVTFVVENVHAKKLYEGGLRRMRRRMSCVLLEPSSHLGGVFNSPGMRPEDTVEGLADSGEDSVRNRVLIAHPIALSLKSTRLFRYHLPLHFPFPTPIPLTLPFGVVHTPPLNAEPTPIRPTPSITDSLYSASLGPVPPEYRAIEPPPRYTDLGRGIRVASRGVKIDGVSCIYTVYIDNPCLGGAHSNWEKGLSVRRKEDSFDEGQVLGSSRLGGRVPEEVEVRGGGSVRVGDARGVDDEDGQELEMGGGGEGVMGGEVEVEGVVHKASSSSKRHNSSSSYSDDEDDFANRLFGSKGGMSDMGDYLPGDLSDDGEHQHEERSEEDAFDSSPEDCSVTFYFYFPHGDSAGKYALGQCSTFLLKMEKNDLYRTVSSSTCHLLHTALRPVYTKFYTTASADEATAAEDAWSIISEEIVRKLIWDVAPKDRGSSLGICVGNKVDDAYEQKKSIQSERERERKAVSEELFAASNILKMHRLSRMSTSIAPLRIHESSSSSSSQHDDPAGLSNKETVFALPLSVPVPVAVCPSLSLSTVVYSCAIRVKVKLPMAPLSSTDMSCDIDDTRDEEMSAVGQVQVQREGEGEGNSPRKNDPIKGGLSVLPENVEEYVTHSPLLHLTLWQRGSSVGIISFDPILREICFLQEQDPVLQAAFIQTSRVMSPSARSHFIRLYFSSLRYSKVLNLVTRVFHGRISFLNPDSEPDEMADITSELDVAKMLATSNLPTLAPSKARNLEDYFRRK